MDSLTISYLRLPPLKPGIVPPVGDMLAQGLAKDHGEPPIVTESRGSTQLAWAEYVFGAPRARVAVGKLRRQVAREVAVLGLDLDRDARAKRGRAATGCPLRAAAPSARRRGRGWRAPTSLPAASRSREPEPPARGARRSPSARRRPGPGPSRPRRAG